jgi:hypothetical protein
LTACTAASARRRTWSSRRRPRAARARSRSCVVSVFFLARSRPQQQACVCVLLSRARRLWRAFSLHHICMCCLERPRLFFEARGGI